ncbi:MAG TPA: DUF5615 family PIN-like protein [bacterium]
MIQLLADENFNNNIIRGLVLRNPDADILRVQDIGLSGADDSVILEWASRNNRKLLTHDAETIPEAVIIRVKSGHPIAGVFIASQSLPIGQVIEDLLLLIECSEEDDWVNHIHYLPL